MRANINDLLDRSEEPEKVIKQLLMDMHTQLLEAKTQVAAAIADQKQLHDHYAEAQTQADEWQHKAELAVEKGEEVLARQALARRATFQQTANAFNEQYEQQWLQVER